MSNIPIVQGHAVNEKNSYVAAGNGGDYDSYGQEHQQQQGPFLGPDGHQQQQQPKQFKDVIWAVAFVVHLIVMFVVIGMGVASGGGGGASAGTYGGVAFVIGTTAAASIVVSTAALSLMMRYATEMVKAALVFTVVMSLLVAVLGFLAGQILLGESQCIP